MRMTPALIYTQLLIFVISALCASISARDVYGCAGSLVLLHCDLLPETGADAFINLRWRFGTSSIAQYTYASNSTFVIDDYKDRVSLTWRTLKLTELRESDAGQYSCAVRYDLDRSDQQNITLDVYELQGCELPSPALFLNGSHLRQNKSDIVSNIIYTMSTTAPDNRPPAVNITYEVNLGYTNTIYHICNQISSSQCISQLEVDLHITNSVAVRVTHVHPATQPSSAEWNLDILDKPTLQGINGINLTNTDKMNITCNIKAKPRAVGTWKYINGSFLPADVFKWTSINYNDGNYIHTTSDLNWSDGSSPDNRKNHGGRITCEAINDVGVAKSSFTLIIHYAAHNIHVNPLSSAVAVEFGSLGPILCYASCKPPCIYRWYKGNTQVSSNAELIIPNVTRDDHGVYECRPDNRILGGQTADFDLTVFYGPSVLSFDVVSPGGPISQHDDVTISCQTDSRPAPIITLIRPSGDTLVSSSTNNVLQYKLANIDCLDSGYYKCVALNALTGRQRSSLLPLTVQCPPRKHSTSAITVAAAEGDTVSFSITVVAYPEPTFSWDKPHEGYFTKTSNTIWCSPHVCTTSSIIIPNITPGDFGNYSVTASNPLGVTKDVVFSLTAADKPDVPSKLSVYHANTVSITMQWTSGWNRGGVQVFTLMYRRLDRDGSYTSITDISDPGRGETVTSKAVGLLPYTRYDLMVRATNRFGSIETKSKTALSAAAPPLDSNDSLSVAISGNKATIIWPLHNYNGPITYVEINSCDVGSARCLITTVLNITSAVEVAVPEGGSSYSFVFRVYDEEDLLLNVNHFIKIDTGTPTGLVVGVVVTGVLLFAAAAVIGVIVWRRRSRGTASNVRDSPQMKARQMCDVCQDKNFEKDTPRECDVRISENPPIQQDQSPYEQIEDSANPTVSVPSVYEHPQTFGSLVVPAVYETLHPENNDSTPAAGRSDNLELSEYANMA